MAEIKKLADQAGSLDYQHQRRSGSHRRQRADREGRRRPPAGGGGGGGGAEAAVAGSTATGPGIIAFQKVLDRMSAPTGQTATRVVDDWPTDTFFTARKNFWFGGEPIEMWNEPSAHSDGDLIVFFRKSDVIVAGDVIAADRYPYIDVEERRHDSGDHQRAEPDHLDGRAGVQPAGRHARHSGPRPDHEPERRRRVPRHGDDHPRPDCDAGQGRGRRSSRSRRCIRHSTTMGTTARPRDRGRPTCSSTPSTRK